MKTYRIDARITVDVVVEIEAESASEARAKFDGGDFDVDYNRAAMTDWDAESVREEA